MGKIDAAELPDGRYLVSARGPLDARVAHQLHDTMVPLAAAEGIPLILDLEDAHGVDDEVLAVISHAAHLIDRQGDRLRIVTRSGSVIRLVDESGLADIVDLYATLKGALER